MKKHPPPLALERARAMRNSPTDAERAMWRLLREHFAGWRFRRQVPLAHAIADFASHRARLVIEVDGGQHGGAGDAARTAMIEGEGYRVIRFWNNDVLGNPAGVVVVIAGVLEGVAHCSSPPSNFG
jgi:very-short-patch-repair endonuclease